MNSKTAAIVAVIVIAVVAIAILAVTMIPQDEGPTDNLRTDVQAGDGISATMTSYTSDCSAYEMYYESFLEDLYPDVTDFEKVGIDVITVNHVNYDVVIYNGYFIDGVPMETYYLEKNSGFMLRECEYNIITETVTSTSFDPVADKSSVVLTIGDYIEKEISADTKSISYFDILSAEGSIITTVTGYDETEDVYEITEESDETFVEATDGVVLSVEGDTVFIKDAELTKTEYLSMISYEHFIKFQDECGVDYILGSCHKTKIDTAYGERTVTVQEILIDTGASEDTYTVYYGPSGIIYQIEYMVTADGLVSVATSILDSTTFTDSVPIR